MPKIKLTDHDILKKVKNALEVKEKLTQSDEVILNIIKSKTLDDFTDQDIKNLKNKYHTVLKIQRLQKVLDNLYAINPNDRTQIENDIIQYHRYEKNLSADNKTFRTTNALLKNYKKRISEDLKLQAHYTIIKNKDKQVNEKIKAKKYYDYEKFFYGSIYITFFNSLSNTSSDIFDTLFDMMKTYAMKHYFEKELFSEEEIKQYNYSKEGRNFNERKNIAMMRFKKSSST